MKYLCSACDRLVEPTAAHLVGDTVELTCPRCGQRDRVDLIRTDPPLSPPTAAATNSEASPRPEPRQDLGQEAPPCPKCSHPRPLDAACPRCGLVGDSWQPAERPLPDDLAAQWREVQARWEDEAAHERLLHLCLHYQQFEEIARRYRTRASQGDPRAQRQLEQLANLGVQALRRAEPPSRFTMRVGRIVGWTLFIALVLAALVLAALFWRLH